MPKKTTESSQLALFGELDSDRNESKNVPDGIIRDQLGGYYDKARGAYIGADGTIFGQRPLYYYSVQIEGWGSPLIHKAWSPEDAEQLASITWIKNIKAGAEARIRATLLDRPPLLPPAPKYLPGPPERAPQIDEEGPVKKKPVHITSGGEPRRRRGRPSLNVSPERIVEALRTSSGIAEAARRLGCSRPYIYKVLGAEAVKTVIGRSSPLAMLDLCCGKKGASQAMHNLGWQVMTLDNNPEFEPDIVADVRSWSYSGPRLRLLWASPPCEEFSRMSMPRTRAKNPPEPDLSIVLGCKRIIDEAKAAGLLDYWILENVRGAVKYLEPILGPYKYRFGPFYLWGEFPELPKIKPEIKKKESYGGNQRAERAKIPDQLSQLVAEALEEVFRK